MTTTSFQQGGDHRPTLPPLVTTGIVGLCIVVFLLQKLLRLYLHHYTLCPRLVLYLHEYYRILTSAFFHVDVMHVGMNVLSASALGAALERRLGSLRLLLTTAWSVLLTSAVYLAIAYLWSALTSNDGLMYQHSVGFSGVLFHYVVLECRLLGDGTRSIFGFVQVPASLYPWALLGVLQLVLPNLSFEGHLSGVLTGTAHASGLLEGWALPQAESLQGFEHSTKAGQWLSSRSNYVRVSETDAPPWSLSRTGGAGSWCGSNGFFHRLRSASAAGLRCARRASEYTGAVVWGRGRAANANVQVSEWWRRLGLSIIPVSRDPTTIITTAHEWSPVPVVDLDAELGNVDIAPTEAEHAMV